MATIEEFTDDLNRMLHSARTKAEGWLGQRKEISRHLAEIRDTAANLLTQLGHGAASAVAPVVRRRRRGRPPGSKNKGQESGIIIVGGKGKRVRRKMSAAARAAISAAQKARWAKVKAGKKK
jgi:hypothetical protein